MVSYTLPLLASLGLAVLAAVWLLQPKKHARERPRDTTPSEKSTIVLPKEPFYLPFLEDNGKVRLGVKALKPEDIWIDIGSAYFDQLKVKNQVIASHWDEVWVSRPAPSTELAKRETMDMVVKYVTSHYPHIFRMEGEYIHNCATQESWKVIGETDKDPLLIASLLVQEDFCILEQENEEGPIILTAGCVCFPMRWSLQDKFMKELTMIHQPVQPFATHLASPVTKALKNLKAPIWRANWSLFDDLESTIDLYTPTSSAERTGEARVKEVEQAGDKLFYRSERQTLSRLPLSNAILFTIRTVQHPLKEVLTLGEKEKVVQGLINAMAVMDTTFREYKGADQWIDVATQYLQQHI